jgi:hypothetical protein
VFVKRILTGYYQDVLAALLDDRLRARHPTPCQEVAMPGMTRESDDGGRSKLLDEPCHPPPDAQPFANVIGEAVTKVQNAMPHRPQSAFRITNPLISG